MSAATKRRKLSDDEAVLSVDDDAQSDAASVVSSSSGDQSSSSEADTEDEIAQLQRQQKSQKTLKRKRRATDSTKFGAALQTLLETDAPSGMPLSLKPSIARRRNDDKLESKARKVIQTEKKDEEDKRRIKDVIGGWGAENERALRKVAQRGVVKLFNAIQQAQAAASDATEESKAQRGSGKPSLPAPSIDAKAQRKKGKQKDNIIGRGKESNIDKDGFLDMIRSGGIVSKA